MKRKPELLSPAGSPASLEAAISAGADAVYFGAESFNARKNAENFTDADLQNGIRNCRLHGVKTNIVLNTQLYSAELSDAIALAYKLLTYGADAFIVADMGLATELKKLFPEICLHASTQCSGQNVLSAKKLQEIGFCRMVAPRELSMEDVRLLCQNSPIETEIFIHGALCVSHSGQCLMSSVIGGRSGNRGECAQPCRLPYHCKNKYALSLKDLCLASYIPDFIDMGVASLKIEGRMKTPDYVYGVVSAYRKLLDENRGATEKEIAEMARFFSRSGFTDGYYTEKINSDMLGIRTESDKTATGKLEKAVMPPRKEPLSIHAKLCIGQMAKLEGTVTRNGETFTASVTGDICEAAEKTPTDKDRIAESLGKLGATPFKAAEIQVETDGINIPISKLNGYRRALCEELETKLVGNIPAYPAFGGLKLPRGYIKSEEKSAYFVYYKTVTEKALAYFDRIFLPLAEYVQNIDAVSKHKNIGIAFPPAAFDHECQTVYDMAKRARDAGAKEALIPGFWQLEMAEKLGFVCHGDIRLNTYNSSSLALYGKMGFASVILSPEIGASASTGVSSPIPKGYVIYGRLPLMTLEKCIIRDEMLPKVMDCNQCHYCDSHPFYRLKDRTDANFPVVREWKHRNVIYNSVPTYMADKPLAGLFSHAIFTDETREEVDRVIDALERKLPAKTKFRRL